MAAPLLRYPPLLLALMLLHERSLGAASPLQQYIADLPRRFEVPLHWAAAELAQLQYPPMAKEVRGCSSYPIPTPIPYTPREPVKPAEPRGPPIASPEILKIHKIHKIHVSSNILKIHAAPITKKVV